MNFPSEKLPARRGPRAAVLLLSLAVVFIPACTSDQPLFREHQATAAEHWRALVARPERPVAAIGWEAAVQKLEAGNAKLRQAREAVRAGEEAVRQVPHNLIPELSINLFAYPTFTNIGEGRLGDTFFYLGSIISLPDPVRYRAEALQARLQFMAAQVEGELLRRDLQVRLFKVFRQASQVARDEAARDALARLAAGNPDSPAAAQARELAAQIGAAWRTIEPELAELLGDYSKHWRPDAGSRLPALDYAAHPPALDGRDGFAALQLTRAALQLLALDAQRQGLLVAEWPQFSVLLTAPPIYQRSAGRESYLSLGDIRVSGFLSYSTDFRGTRALRRRQAARRDELVRRDLDLALQATVARLQDGLALLAELESRVARLRDAEAVLRQAGAVVEAANLTRETDALIGQVDDLNLSFWVLDGSRWPSPS